MDHHPAVVYARAFALCDGRGKREGDAFARLAAAYGPGRAASVRALAWFLLWGSWTGNTMNAAIGYKSPKPGTSQSFLFQLLCWYGVLFFLIITFVSALVKIFPPLPRWASAAFGVLLAVVAGIFFLPLGLVGTLVGARRTAAGKAAPVRSPITLLKDFLAVALVAFVALAGFKAVFGIGGWPWGTAPWGGEPGAAAAGAAGAAAAAAGGGGGSGGGGGISSSSSS